MFICTGLLNQLNKQFIPLRFDLEVLESKDKSELLCSVAEVPTDNDRHGVRSKLGLSALSSALLTRWIFLFVSLTYLARLCLILETPDVSVNAFFSGRSSDKLSAESPCSVADC